MRSRSNLRQLLARRDSVAEMFGDQQGQEGGGGGHAAGRGMRSGAHLKQGRSMQGARDCDRDLVCRQHLCSSPCSLCRVGHGARLATLVLPCPPAAFRGRQDGPGEVWELSLYEFRN